MRPDEKDEQRYPSNSTSRDADLQTIIVRLGTGLTFLAALMTATTGWYLIGGTGHFEVTAWYLKCGLCFGWAAAITMAVHRALDGLNGWQASVKRWIWAAVLISVAMGLITYYYHSQEPPDEQVTEEESTARL